MTIWDNWQSACFRRGAPEKKRFPTVKARELDNKFDQGEDISSAIDWSKARRVNTEIKRVNVDFPTWVVEGLDRQANRLGITRQALIKVWIAERLG